MPVEKETKKEDLVEKGVEEPKNPTPKKSEDPKDKVVHITKGGNTIKQSELNNLKKKGAQWNSVEEYGEWIDRSFTSNNAKYTNPNSMRMYVEDPMPQNGKSRFYETKDGVQKDISREQFDIGRSKTKRNYEGEPIDEIKPMYGVKKPK